jgi:predicted naringenin-chalcone synthase
MYNPEQLYEQPEHFQQSEDPLYRDAVAYAREQIQRELLRKQELQAVYHETQSSHRGEAAFSQRPSPLAETVGQLQLPPHVQRVEQQFS